MPTEMMAFIFGCILILAGIIGGGFQVKELTIPKISLVPRLIAIVFGIIFIIIGIYLPNNIQRIPSLPQVVHMPNGPTPEPPPVKVLSSDIDSTASSSQFVGSWKVSILKDGGERDFSTSCEIEATLSSDHKFNCKGIFKQKLSNPNFSYRFTMPFSETGRWKYNHQTLQLELEVIPNYRISEINEMITGSEAVKSAIEPMLRMEGQRLRQVFTSENGEKQTDTLNIERGDHQNFDGRDQQGILWRFERI